MASPISFPHAAFLGWLEHVGASAPRIMDGPMPPPLARILLAADDSHRPTPACAHLVELLLARKAMLQAAFDTGVVADELRRYQKFARPGQPSPHIVQLRQQQAAARQASNQSKQSFIKATAAFVRETGIEVPPRVALEVFVIGWIEAHVPKDANAAN